MRVAEPYVAVSYPPTWRWTRDQYYRLAEEGFFQDQRVERIGGEIVPMSPQNPAHFSEIKRIETALEFAFGRDHWIRVQGPLALGADSDPEPDLAVVKGSYEDYADSHPTSALLVIEVSDSTLQYDRVRKGSLYASAGVADYWIVNLCDKQLEVYRNPVRDRMQPFGFRYDRELILKAGKKIAPLAKPKAALSVAKLIPPGR